MKSIFINEIVKFSDKLQAFSNDLSDLVTYKVAEINDLNAEFYFEEDVTLIFYITSSVNYTLRQQ